MSRKLYVAVSPSGKPFWESLFDDEKECKCRVMNAKARSWIPHWRDFKGRGWTVQPCKIVLLKEPKK